MSREDSSGEALRRVTALLEFIRARQDSDEDMDQGAGHAADTDVVARVVDGLTLLRALRTELAGWEPELIAAARRAGASWAQLAPALGVASRQAAERRYLRLQPTDGHQTTREARVQAIRDQRAGDRAVTAWAQQNSAELRQLAGQVSAVDGLSAAGQREADRVHAELAGNDPTSLLGPLTDLRAHLADRHPELADRITTVSADADQRRHATVHDRHRPGRA